MLENKKIIYISKNGETYFSPKNIIPGNCQVFKHIGNSKNSEIFLLRLPLKLNKKDHNDLFAYKNMCPHQKISLDLKPGNFFNYDKTAIQCSTHGALFRIDDGFCFKGPCSGKLLEKVDFKIKNDKIIFFL